MLAHMERGCYDAAYDVRQSHQHYEGIFVIFPFLNIQRMLKKTLF